MSSRRLTRTCPEVAHIRSELRWIVFEVAISLVRRTKDRRVLFDVARNLDRLAERLRRVATRSY